MGLRMYAAAQQFYWDSSSPGSRLNYGRVLGADIRGEDVT